MNLVLDISTSLEFWRRIYYTDRAPASPGPVSISQCASAKAEVEKLAPTWAKPEFLAPIGGRLHVLVFGKAPRRRSSDHVVHVWNGPVPEGSFFNCGKGVLIASPGFIFLGAASLLSDIRLIALGHELCGLYGFDESDERGFRKRSVPLTTIAQLRQYLACAKDCRGWSKANAALQHVVERSASPMETFDVMAMCLPYRLGGYCLRRPIMNYEVKLSSRAARIAKQSTCYPDMCYPKVPLDVEHYGQYDHSKPEDKASDRARVNALKEMGYEVIELTCDQVDDLLAFEYIIQRVARLTKKRIDHRKLGATPARLRFRAEIIAWNKSSGRLR